MRIGEVIGRVTLSRSHRLLERATWKIVVPLTGEGLKGGAGGREEPLIVYDEFSSGNGSLIAISDGAEAAAPFHPETKPIDAYCAALLDEISLHDEK